MRSKKIYINKTKLEEGISKKGDFSEKIFSKSLKLKNTVVEKTSEQAKSINKYLPKLQDKLENQQEFIDNSNSKSDLKELNVKRRRFPFSIFWFLIGFILAAIFLSSFVIFFIQFVHNNKVYDGIFVENIPLGGKTKDQVQAVFDKKNEIINKNSFTLIYQDKTATVSAQDLDIGYNSKLMSDQTYSLGRSNGIFTNIYLVASAYTNEIHIPASYTFSTNKLNQKLDSIQSEIYIKPEEALFTFSNNRVLAFKESRDGKTIDYEALNKIIEEKTHEIIKNNEEKNFNIQIPIKILKPNITTEKANNLGIVEAIGEGKSSFKGSIENRVHNVNLATSRLNGILVAPNETFSFNKSVGDISKETGYKEAYVIKNGKTVLGDGGGVCQVSTTLFRAVLNSGLPILERKAHAYRVGYYEQDSAPGLDATVFDPYADFKFKNDTANHILIQSSIDLDNLNLTFTLYGKIDDRQVEITKPLISNQTPPPDPLYQDDPNLAKGVTKQIEHSAPGANVIFKRIVKKSEKIIYSDAFSSHYTPWQAVYLRGTKE